VSAIGTPCGCILAGYLTDLLGRKRTLIALQLPAIVGWLIVGTATSVQWIYLGRFLVGLSSGMIGAPSRVYTAEVSQPHLRGVLAAFASVGTSLGNTGNRHFVIPPSDGMPYKTCMNTPVVYRRYVGVPVRFSIRLGYVGVHERHGAHHSVVFNLLHTGIAFVADIVEERRDPLQGQP